MLDNMNTFDFRVTQQHAADLQRQAEQERLAHVAQTNDTHSRLTNVLLAWFGRRLVRFGLRLLVVSRDWERRADIYSTAEVNLFQDHVA